MVKKRSNDVDEDETPRTTLTTEEYEDEEQSESDDDFDDVEEYGGGKEEREKHGSDAKKTPPRSSRSSSRKAPQARSSSRRRRKTPQAVFTTPPRSTSKADRTPPPTSTPKTGYSFGKTADLNQAGLNEGTEKTFSWSCFMDGTRDNPWRSQVNVDFPERHLNGLDVQFVNNMIHTRGTGKEYMHDGYHIRRTVAVLDFALWEATIPVWGSYPPEFEDQVVLIKGPSRDHWINDTTAYHSTKKVQCDSTKTAHQATQMAIETNENRRGFCYTLLLFGENVKLDNNIFSDDGDNLATIVNGLTIKGKDNETKKDLFSAVVFWRIALAGGKKLTNGAAKAKAHTLFS
jgi:hypothetical protein